MRADGWISIPVAQRTRCAKKRGRIGSPRAIESRDEPVRDERMDAGIREQDVKQTTRGRVALQRSAYVVAQLLPEIHVVAPAVSASLRASTRRASIRERPSSAKTAAIGGAMAFACQCDADDLVGRLGREPDGLTGIRNHFCRGYCIRRLQDAAKSVEQCDRARLRDERARLFVKRDRGREITLRMSDALTERMQLIAVSNREMIEPCGLQRFARDSGLAQALGDQRRQLLTRQSAQRARIERTQACRVIYRSGSADALE